MIGSLTIPLGEVLLVLLSTVKYVLKGFNLVVKVWVCETVDISDIVSQLDSSILEEPWKVFTA